MLNQGFNEFWDAFADKRGKDGALRAWRTKRLHRHADEVITAAKAYAKIRGSDKRLWKMPQGWLNDGRWRDEVLSPVKELPLDQQAEFVVYGSPEWVEWMATLPAPLNPIQSAAGYGRWKKPKEQQQ